MTLSATLATAAQSLVTKYGETVTHTRVTGGTLAPATGTLTGGTSTSTTIKAAPRAYNKSYADVFQVQTGDAFLMVDNTLAPLPGDTVVMDSGTWKIIGVQAYRVQGVDLAYLVQIRK